MWGASMTIRPDDRATYADVLAAPDSLVAEILEGQLVLSPRPVPRHANVAFNLAGDLMGPFQRGLGGPGGWRFLFEPELWLGPAVERNATVVVPDIAGWSTEGFARIDLDHVGIHERPDWVCEVLSPTGMQRDLVVKRRIYAAAHVPFYWIVHPRRQQVLVLRLEGETYVEHALHEGDGEVALPPFEAVAVDVGRWW